MATARQPATPAGFPVKQRAAELPFMLELVRVAQPEGDSPPSPRRPSSARAATKCLSPRFAASHPSVKQQYSRLSMRTPDADGAVLFRPLSARAPTARPWSAMPAAAAPAPSPSPRVASAPAARPVVETFRPIQPSPSNATGRVSPRLSAARSRMAVLAVTAYPAAAATPSAAPSPAEAWSARRSPRPGVKAKRPSSAFAGGGGPSDVEAALALMRRLRLFEDEPEPQLRLLIAHATVRTYERYTVVAREGGRGPVMSLVVHGSIVRWVSPERSWLVAGDTAPRELPSGEMWGEEALLGELLFWSPADTMPGALRRRSSFGADPSRGRERERARASSSVDSSGSTPSANGNGGGGGGVSAEASAAAAMWGAPSKRGGGSGEAAASRNDATYQAVDNATRVLLWAPSVLAKLRHSLPRAVEAARLQLCINLLRPLAFFKNTPAATLEVAAGLFVPKFCAASQLLHAAADAADSMVVLAEGLVRLDYPARQQRPAWTDDVTSRGNTPWFGTEILHSASRGRPATAVATDPCKLLLLPQSNVDRFKELLPQFIALASANKEAEAAAARSQPLQGDTKAFLRPPVAIIARRWEKVVEQLLARAADGFRQGGTFSHSFSLRTAAYEGHGANPRGPAKPVETSGTTYGATCGVAPSCAACGFSEFETALGGSGAGGPRPPQPPAGGSTGGSTGGGRPRLMRGYTTCVQLSADSVSDRVSGIMKPTAQGGRRGSVAVRDAAAGEGDAAGGKGGGGGSPSPPRTLQRQQTSARPGSAKASSPGLKRGKSAVTWLGVADAIELI